MSHNEVIIYTVSDDLSRAAYISNSVYLIASIVMTFCSVDVTFLSAPAVALTLALKIPVESVKKHPAMYLDV